MELKCRAWDGQKMVVPDWITTPPVGYWCEYDDKTLSFDVIKHSDKIMLRTPFKDKDGVDIYDGDIITYEYVFDPTQKKEHEVYFDKECGAWFCKNGQQLCNVIMEQNNDDFKKSKNLDIRKEQYVKIIGNIYERRTIISRT